MRYLSAAGIWMTTIWMDVTVMRLPGDNSVDEFVLTLLTIGSIIFTLAILFHGSGKKGA